MTHHAGVRCSLLLFAFIALYSLPAQAQYDHFKQLESLSTPGSGIDTKALMTSQAQAYASALVQLKLEAVDLNYATPKDDKAIEINLLKQRMMIREMAELTVVHLRRRRAELSKTFKPGHPTMIELDKEIKDRLALAGVEETP